MNSNLKFYAFRYFLIANDQISIYHNMIKDKRSIIKDIFIGLEKNNKIIKILEDRKYILCLTDKVSENIYLCKFAKENHFTKFEEKENDIEDIPDYDYPFVYLIIDLYHQIILMQEKSSVFRHIATAKNKLIEWVTQGTEMFDYNFKIDEITHEHLFWNYVDNSEGIFEVNLKMKSPNLFEGWLDSNKLLKKLREIFNNTETNLKLNNENGKLKIDREVLESFIKYITGGGGEWKLKAKFNGIIQTLKSKDCIKIVNMPKESENNVIEFRNLIVHKLTDVEDILGVSVNEDNKNK